MVHEHVHLIGIGGTGMASLAGLFHDAGYRVTEWMAASLRYDRVVLDVDDSANSFRILSPRISFFTSFITREMLYIQYSRYLYNERVRLRTGQQNLETIPDDHVLKIQAQMSF